MIKMKKSRYLISEQLLEDRKFYNSDDYLNSINKFFYFLYYMIFCNILPLLFPLIYINNKLPFSIYMTIFIYNFSCLIILIIITICIKIKQKIFNNNRNLIGENMYMAIEFFFVGKIFFQCHLQI